MADITVSANVDTFMQSANFAAMRTNLGLSALATTTPGTGVATALTVNIGTAGSFVVNGGALGTPSTGNLANTTGFPIAQLSGAGAGVLTFLATPSSANLLAAVTNETGTGALTFATGPILDTPQITTGITTGSTTFALVNATATTVNFAGAATTLNVGASAAMVLNFGGSTTAAQFRFLEPSASGTNYSAFSATAQSANINYTLPATIGTTGQVLTTTTTGANAVLSWETPSGSGNVTAGGTLTNNTLIIGQGTTAVASTTTGTGVLTALGVNVGSAGAFVAFNGALGTPSSGTVTNLTGTASININGTVGATTPGTGAFTTVTGSGAFTALNATAIPAGGTAGSGYKFSSTANFGVFFGSGVPSLSAAQGSLYLRSDGVPYINNNGTTGWTVLSTGGGGGDVVGPGSSTDNAIAVWNGTGGTSLEDSSVIVATDKLQTGNGDTTTAAYGFTSQTNSGLYLVTAGVVGVAAGGTQVASMSTTSFVIPASPLLLGTAGSVVGTAGFRNATSGTITVSPPAGALGTVTQTLQAVTGTILSTGGIDVPVADGGTGLSSGTSGGVLAFTASGTIASSAALAANAIVLGGGAGAVPATTTTGTGVVTALGVNTGSAGAFVVNGGALGTPSSGVGTNLTGIPIPSLVAGILAGNMTLGESTGQIVLDPTLSADGTWSGIMQAGTAGATLAFGDVVYFQASDSRWELTDADAEATSGPLLVGMCVLAAAADGDPTNILLYGKIRADANFPALTIGAPVYISTTPGDIQVAQPSGTDDVIRILGHAITADAILFAPDPTWIVHT